METACRDVNLLIAYTGIHPGPEVDMAYEGIGQEGFKLEGDFRLANVKAKVVVLDSIMMQTMLADSLVENDRATNPASGHHVDLGFISLTEEVC